jgi:hypothetical protein
LAKAKPAASTKKVVKKTTKKPATKIVTRKPPAKGAAVKAVKAPARSNAAPAAKAGPEKTKATTMVKRATATAQHAGEQIKINAKRASKTAHGIADTVVNSTAGAIGAIVGVVRAVGNSKNAEKPGSSH